MKKNIFIILFIFVLLAVVAYGIFYLFSKNRSAFMLSLNPDQALDEPAASNISNVKNMLTLSSVFPNNGRIPDKYGCRDLDVNPPLQLSGVPANALSLALIIDDPDAPSGDWVHWLVFNIDPKTLNIKENSVPAGASLGMTSSGEASYSGPCPPSGIHHYHFKLYALDSILNLTSSADKSALLKAMKGHILDQTELIGTYSR